MKRALAVRLAVSLASASAFLAGAGCDEFADPYRTVVPSGRIQGLVRTGELPVAGDVFLDRIDGPDEQLAIRLEVGDDGSFGLDVPAGDYIVTLRLDGLRHRYLYARPLPAYRSGTPDTVRIDAAHSPVTADFDLGSLVFTMDLSSRLDGTSADVVVHRCDDGGDASAQTAFDNDGAEIDAGRLAARFTGLLPGDYRIEVVLGGDYGWGGSYRHEHFWLPGTRDPAESPRYGVAADAVVAVHAELMAPPARLEGRISGAWLELTPGASPRLSFVALDSTELVGDHEIDADGSFAIDFLVPAAVKIFVEHAYVGQWIGGTGFADATVYDASPGQTVAGIDFVSCGLLLHVRAPEPYWGSLVIRLFDSADLTLLGSGGTYGGPSFTIGIANLRPGGYLVHLAPETPGSAYWRPQWFDGAATAAEALPIRLTEAGEIAEIAPLLERGGAIGGRLVPPAGSAGYYVVVATTAQECAEWGRRTVHVDEPAFSLTGLPDGGFKVGAVAVAEYFESPSFPHAAIRWFPGTSDWDAAGVVEIAGAATVTGVDIVIPSP